ncbi:MAG: hypothetical protein ACRDJ1_09805, partial [Actinomycetota bacterium]
LKISPAGAEWIIAGGITGLVTGLALSAAWVFRARMPLEVAPSIWAELLGDRVTFGLIRLLVATASLYALVSIGVLASRRRWVRSISTTGIEVDAAVTSNDTIAALRADLQQALIERDEARRLARRITHG